MSVVRTSLGKCNDLNVKRVFESYKKGLVKAGDEVVVNGKSYFAGGLTATTKVKNALGEVRKEYRLHNDGDWYLHGRTVENSRGKYSRRVNTLMGKTSDRVSLGGQQEFVKQEDGTYVQRTAGFPFKVVSSEEMEAAIDYVKGKGSAESYKKLLRTHR